MARDRVVRRRSQWAVHLAGAAVVVSLLSGSLASCEEAGTAGSESPFGQVTEPTPGADELIAALTSSTDSAERETAARLLGELGDAAAAGVLIDALEDSSEDVRIAAAGAVGSLGEARAVTGLVALVAGGSTAERRAALAAIRAIGSGAIAPLVRLANGTNRETAIAAIDGLAALEAAGISSLIALLASDDAKLRSTAANRLGRIGDRRAEKPLVALLTDTAMGRTASMALARLYADEATKLVPYLAAKKTVGAYYGIIRLGDAGTVKPLVTALDRYGDVDMAEAYLNCGNQDLEDAAHRWADTHGYDVYTVPGAGDGTWGGGFED